MCIYFNRKLFPDPLSIHPFIHSLIHPSWAKVWILSFSSPALFRLLFLFKERRPLSSLAPCRDSLPRDQTWNMTVGREPENSGWRRGIVDRRTNYCLRCICFCWAHISLVYLMFLGFLAVQRPREGKAFEL